MDKSLLSFDIKEKIRETKLGNLKIGGASARSFMRENDNIAKPLVAIEIPYTIDNTYPEVLQTVWGCDKAEQMLEKASKSEADIISIKFNLTEDNIDNCISDIAIFLKNNVSKISKPIILRGANNDAVDLKLLPFLAQNAPKQCIISFAQESTYEQIVPVVAKYNHLLVLRSPIDINLAKELNILSIDKGIAPENILIDPDMGGLGYGLDYGYSIIEKIRQAAFDGDTMLNMPIIAFIGEESYRAKEAKSDTFDSQWGDYKERAAMWEISGACAMISAGADIVVLWNPQSVQAIKSLLKGENK